MSNELIPELHDVLKITTLKHNFEDFSETFKKHIPNTQTWKGVIQHHCSEGFPGFPTDKETFLLHFADGLASNFSRHQQSYKGEKNFVLYKLWNSNWKREDNRLKTEGDIIELLKFLSKGPSFDEFRKKYKEVLETRAEDAHPGMNITSLETHLVLTGKFYRFLRNSNKLTIQENEIIPSIEGISKLRDAKKNTWHLHLAQCKFKFNQKPIRARDLNIFSLLEEVLTEIEGKFFDNILYITSDEIFVFYDDTSILDKFTSIAINKGLWISIYEGYPRLNEITRFLRKQKYNERNIYPPLPSSITPPICEICQMAISNRVWPEDFYYQFGKDIEVVEGGTENLCETCFSIRSRPSKLKKLSIWTELEDADVLWVKINLDYEKLISTLQQLYLSFLRQNNPLAKKEDAEIRFSLVSEFYKDYNSFLVAFKKLLLDCFYEERVEIILRDMFCIKVEERKDIFICLKEFNKLLNQFFPEFKKFVSSPIKICLVYSRSKFPFFEVWKKIEEQISSLRIILIGHGLIDTSIKYIDEILVAGSSSYRKSALYKLAEISKISEKLAELKFYDKSDKEDFESYESLKRNLLPLGMNFSSLLTFAKLIEG